jgi:predicted transcriptional regulator
MTNTTIGERTLIVRLDAELKQRLKIRAAVDRTDMSKIAREALGEYLDKLERADRARQVVEELTGSAGPGMSTDEIMALTRGE